MELIKRLWSKYREVISYLFFGACTTVVNIAAYYLCYNFIHIDNVPSTIIAWVLSVLFAFVTNKLFVFESKTFERRTLLKELAAFFGCRVFTGALDVGIMYLAVDVMSGSSMLWKIISNIIVIILNYVAGKLLVFAGSKKDKAK